MVKIYRKGFLFLALLTLGLAGIPRQDACAASPGVKKKEVVVGGLFSLTGGWSTLGQSSRAALEVAVDDVNAYLSRVDARIRFAALVEDTQLIPELALEKLRLLAKQKVRIVVGPQSSAEVARLKAFADANDVLIISQSSTAGTLAIAGDNIFRFTPADDLEGEAIAALMHADGVKTVVPLWRDDPGNSGLHEATTKDFQALGGRVESGVEYSSSASDFSAAVAAVSAQVSAARVATGDDAAVAVYLAGFDEVAAIFQLAQGDAVLASTRWYGSDGVALSGALLNDPVAAAFAQRVGYPNPLFGLDEAAAVKWEPVAARIREKTGTEPESFALGVYDAVWVAAKALISHRGRVSFDEFTQDFPEEAASFFGTTGWTVLNAAGDRQFGNFDFWAIRTVDSSRQWTRVARYNTATKEIVRDEP